MQKTNSPQDSPDTQIVTRARVRQFRKRQLFTMREFARALEYHPNYIRAVECGALPVSGIFAIKFLRLEQDTYSRQQIRSRYVLPTRGERKTKGGE